jgi:hypothetical protein
MVGQQKIISDRHNTHKTNDIPKTRNRKRLRPTDKNVNGKGGDSGGLKGPPPSLNKKTNVGPLDAFYRQPDLNYNNSNYFISDIQILPEQRYVRG